jgi:death-on-curing family protein
MEEIKYISKEKLIELNILVLNQIKVKKADKAEVLSYSKIDEIINLSKNKKGDLYDKAIVLLKHIIKSHAFASGNRRTAFVTTKYFITENKGKFRIKNIPENANVMQGIREDFYSDNEIKEWILNGEIKRFERR